MGESTGLLTTHPLTVATVVAVVAGLMRGFAGVGSGMLMAPFFAVVFGPVETVATIILMELVVTAQLLPGVHRDIEWRTIAPIGGAALVAMPAGALILARTDPEILSRGIAVVVLVFTAVLMSGWRYRGAPGAVVGAAVGGASGVLMAATSLGNPPVMVLLLSGPSSAKVNRANFTGYFAITLVGLALWMALWGTLGGAAIVNALTLLAPFMLAAWAGSRLFRQSSEVLYRRIAYGLLLAAGIYGLIR